MSVEGCEVNFLVFFFGLKDRRLINQLQISWPDVENGKHMEFWKHEWNDHGVCSRNTFGQTQYFQETHMLWSKPINNLTAILKNVIQPGPLQEFNASDIEGPIKLATGKKPRPPSLQD